MEVQKVAKDTATKSSAEVPLLGGPAQHLQRLRKSPRLPILWRCAKYHLIPFAGCIILVYLNLKTLYIGNELPGTRAITDTAKLQALQLAAKLHEIFLLASLAVVALDIVTYRLVQSRRGLPLGLVGAAFSFNSLDFIISAKFLSAFKSVMPIAYKVAVGFLVVFFCGLAHTVGPTSAMLMIPTNQTWQTAGYTFSANGSPAQLWPESLTSQHIGSPSCSDGSFALKNASCVAGGYTSLLPYFNGFNRLPKQFAFSFNMEDSLSKRTAYGNIRNDWERGSETWVQSTHLAPTILAEPIRSRWAFNLRFLPDNWHWTGVCNTKVKSRVPVVRAVCIPNVNLGAQSGAGDTFSMAFPVLPEYEFWFYNETGAIYGLGPSASQDLPRTLLDLDRATDNKSTNTSGSLRVRTQWVKLSDKFDSTSIGIALLFTRENSSNQSQFSDGLACSVDARWADGENTNIASQIDWAWAGYSGTMKSVVSSRRIPYDDYGGLRLFLPKSDGSWSRVSIDADWANALTPTVRDRDTTTLGAILEDTIPSFIGEKAPLKTYLGNETNTMVPMVEHFLSIVVADGMSRVGSHLQPALSSIQEALDRIPYHQFSQNGNHTLNLSATGPEFTNMYLQTEVEGYGYSISGGIGDFAIVIMMLYMIVVLSHTAFALLYSVSASEWSDWVTMMALVFRSKLRDDGSQADKESLEDMADVLVKAVKDVDGVKSSTMSLVRARKSLKR